MGRRMGRQALKKIRRKLLVGKKALPPRYKQGRGQRDIKLLQERGASMSKKTSETLYKPIKSDSLINGLKRRSPPASRPGLTRYQMSRRQTRW